MISKILSPGDRIELERVVNKDKLKNVIIQETTEIKPYISQIYDIIDDEQLKIAMPIIEGRVTPLPQNARYDACFFTHGGLFKGRIVITDRYKEDGLFVLAVELTTELKKYQRRQYYRLEYTMDIDYIIIDAQTENMILEDEKAAADILTDNKLTNGTVLDISGGGIRFCSDEKLEVGSKILVDLNILLTSSQEKCGVIGIVLSSNRIQNKDGLYEQRIEYTNIKGPTRESIIRYIFEQERKIRKK